MSLPMYAYLKKARIFVSKHKFLSALAIVVVVAGSYWTYAKLTDTSKEPRYLVATIEKGTLISSITGSGQVSASNQVELKPKASGEVVYIHVTDGQEVKAGGLIAQLNAGDAQKTVRDAQVNLQSAKISLEKLQQPTDKLSLTQAENALAQAKEDKIKVTNDLAKAYSDAFTTISNAFLDLPVVVTGVQNILYKNDYTTSQDNLSYYADSVQTYDLNITAYRDSAASAYAKARKAYDANFLDYKAASRYSSTANIEQLLDQTNETAKLAAEAVKSANDFLSFINDRTTEHHASLPSQFAAHQTSLSGYISKANTNLVNLLSSKNTVENDKNSIISQERTIIERQQSLAKLQGGAEALDLASAKLTITQRENALMDAQEKLADYYIRAPFDGTIAKIAIKRGDSVPSGTAVATLITKQKIAELSLNEVDAGKIKVGQKSTLVFDAVDGLSISGQVAQIDTIGTVTQGVVTYAVKISFDTEDSRVKPGMSVSAAIITDLRTDVLMAPNSAIKTSGNTHYVEIGDAPAVARTTGAQQGILLANPPQQQPVEIGLSNDTATEIISGLTEGDQVISRTITATVPTTSQVPSLIGGGNTRIGGGAGGVRTNTGAGR